MDFACLPVVGRRSGKKKGARQVEGWEGAFVFKF